MCAVAILIVAVFGWLTPDTAGATPDVTCGSQCLYVGLKGLGLAPKTYAALEKSIGPPSARGYSMLELENEARKHGASTLAVETTLEHLSARDQPYVCLTLINGNHYVLIKNIADDNIELIDPPRSVTVNRDAFGTLWDRKVLLLATSPLTSEADLRIAGGMTMLGWSATVLFLLCGAVGCLIAWKKRGRPAHSILIVLAITVAGNGCGGSPKAENRPGLPESWNAKESSSTIAGHLEIEPSVISLGKVFRHSTNLSQTARATLRNTGTGTLEILETLVSCDCTKVSFGTKTLAPQASTSVTASIRLGDTTEPRSTSVRIRTNDVTMPISKLRIDWQVINPLTTEKVVLQLPQLKPGECLTVQEPVFLDGLGLCPRCKVVLTADTSQIKARLETNDMALQSTRGHAKTPPEKILVGNVHLTVKGQIDPKMYRDQLALSLECDKEERARYLLPITWNVAPIVMVSPSRISLGSTLPGDVVRQTVILRSTRSQGFHIKGVRDGDHRLDGQIVRADEAIPLQIINFAVRAPRKEGPWRSMIYFLTDHEESTSIMIPISGIVVKARTADTAGRG